MLDLDVAFELFFFFLSIFLYVDQLPIYPSNTCFSYVHD